MSNPGTKPPSPRPYRRRRKWVRSDIQLKIILMTLSVATIVLAINFQMNLFALSSIQGHPETSIDGVFHQINGSLLRQLLLSFCLVVPLSIWVGAIYAFKFCGPIYRFRGYFQELLEGRWDQPCTLRAGDDLQDVKDSINAAIEVFGKRIRSQNEVLKKVRPVLEASSEAPEKRRTIEEIIHQIEREETEFSRRFGGVESALPSELVRDKVACSRI